MSSEYTNISIVVDSEDLTEEGVIRLNRCNYVGVDTPERLLCHLRWWAKSSSRVIDIHLSENHVRDLISGLTSFVNEAEARRKAFEDIELPNLERMNKSVKL
jgi:hypothetical protein